MATGFAEDFKQERADYDSKIASLQSKLLDM